MPMMEYGFTDSEWRSAISEAIAILQECAAAQSGWVTYGDLASRLKSIRIDPFGGPMNHLLTKVSEEENAAGRPLLSAIVVREEDKTPGNGFFTLAKWLGFKFSDPDDFWIKEFTKATDYWKKQSISSK